VRKKRITNLGKTGKKVSKKKESKLEGSALNQVAKSEIDVDDGINAEVCEDRKTTHKQ